MKTLCGIVISLFLASCNVLLDTDTKVEDLKGDCENLSGSETKILFIGNSFISQNNMPKMLSDIACSKLIPTKIFSMTNHNFRIMDHAQAEDTKQIIKIRKWDYVIIQNHGQVPSWPETQLRDESLPYVEELANLIYANSAETKIIYLQTWGRLAGDQTNCAAYALVCDLAGHTQALKEGYQIYADATNASVALVGDAFLEVYESDNSEIEPADLWHEDGAHPSAVGTYLAASVLFAKIFSQTPVGAFASVNLTKVQRLYLQSIAAQSVGP